MFTFDDVMVAYPAAVTHGHVMQARDAGKQTDRQTGRLTVESARLALWGAARKPASVSVLLAEVLGKSRGAFGGRDFSLL